MYEITYVEKRESLGTPTTQRMLQLQRSQCSVLRRRLAAADQLIKCGSLPQCHELAQLMRISIQVIIVTGILLAPLRSFIIALLQQLALDFLRLVSLLHAHARKIRTGASIPQLAMAQLPLTPICCHRWCPCRVLPTLSYYRVLIESHICRVVWHNNGIERITLSDLGRFICIARYLCGSWAFYSALCLWLLPSSVLLRNVIIWTRLFAKQGSKTDRCTDYIQ